MFNLNFQMLRIISIVSLPFHSAVQDLMVILKNREYGKFHVGLYRGLSCPVI